MDGQENLQEILSKRLYLCQFLCSLMILREGQYKVVAQCPNLVEILIEFSIVGASCVFLN